MNKFIYICLMILGIVFICILSLKIYMKIMQRRFIKKINDFDNKRKEIVKELLKHGK